MLSLSSLSGKDATEPWITIPLKQALTGTKVLFSRMEVTATQRLDWEKCCNFHPADSHPIGVEESVLVLKECENSHTLTTITTGSKNSQNVI